jgi:hypothetical protein
MPKASKEKVSMGGKKQQVERISGTRRMVGGHDFILVAFGCMACGTIATHDPDGQTCTGETAAELCRAVAATCGEIDATDRCSSLRRVDCGGCSMGQMCGGGGAKNVCDSHPPLAGVDGYIVGAGTQYSVSFALDGVTNNGGFCCETTPDGARAAYPGKNLVVLPGQTQLAPDQIPPLRHVDGYIIQNAINNTKFEYRGAVDGAMDGISECCTADVATMRSLYPTKNLAYLPFFGQ